MAELVHEFVQRLAQARNDGVDLERASEMWSTSSFGCRARRYKSRGPLPLTERALPAASCRSLWTAEHAAGLSGRAGRVFQLLLKAGVRGNADLPRS